MAYSPFDQKVSERQPQKAYNSVSICRLHLDIGTDGKFDETNSLWPQVVQDANDFHQKVARIIYDGQKSFCSLYLKSPNFCLTCPAYQYASGKIQTSDKQAGIGIDMQTRVHEVKASFGEFIKKSAERKSEL